MKQTIILLFLLLIVHNANAQNKPLTEIKRGEIQNEKLHGQVEKIVETQQKISLQKKEPIITYNFDTNKNIIAVFIADSLGKLQKSIECTYNTKNLKTTEIRTDITRPEQDGNMGTSDSTKTALNNDAVLKQITKYSYNKQDKLIQETYYTSVNEDNPNIVNIKYDAQGNLQPIQPYIKYTYDNKHRRTLETMYETDETTQKVTSKWYNKSFTVYNAKGQITKNGIMNSDSSNNFTQNYKYNKAGQVIQIEQAYTGKSYTEKTYSKIDLTYNEQNLLSQAISYKRNGSKDSAETVKKIQFIYEFDTQNNWTSYTVKTDNGILETTKRTITYYAK